MTCLPFYSKWTLPERVRGQRTWAVPRTISCLCAPWFINGGFNWRSRIILLADFNVTLLAPEWFSEWSWVTKCTPKAGNRIFYKRTLCLSTPEPLLFERYTTQLVHVEESYTFPILFTSEYTFPWFVYVAITRGFPSILVVKDHTHYLLIRPLYLIEKILAVCDWV